MVIAQLQALYKTADTSRLKMIAYDKQVVHLMQTLAKVLAQANNLQAGLDKAKALASDAAIAHAKADKSIARLRLNYGPTMGKVVQTPPHASDDWMGHSHPHEGTGDLSALYDMSMVDEAALPMSEDSPGNL